MFTGLSSHEAGVPFNGYPIREELRQQELGNWLARAGYECAYAGKWHVPGGSITDDHGFQKIADRGDTHLAEHCVDFLRQKHERPFFLVASFINPHDICQWARNQTLPWGPIPEEPPVEECPNLPANFAIPPLEPDILRLEMMASPKIYPSVRFTDEHWRRYRNAYFRLCEKVDSEIGRILDALRKDGLEDDTLVVFSSDHGDGHGAHHWNQKSVLYDEVVRCPFILSWKGVTRAGHLDREHLVSNGLDLMPTLCDYAGVEPPEGLPGRSVRPIAEGREVDAWHDHLVAETWLREGDGTRGRMVRTNRYKYICYDWGRYREQLFDMDEDPGEMVNLAVNAAYRSVLQEHRSRLSKWCEETEDVFDVPGREWIRGSRSTS